MKKLCLLLILVGFAFGFSIQNDAKFEEIYKTKSNKDKIVLMIYTAKSCPQCAYMKKKVFTQKNIKNFMDENFVVLEKDIDKDDLPENFEYIGIPTMFFVNSKGEQIDKFVGSARADEFWEVLKNSKDKQK